MQSAVLLSLQNITMILGWKSDTVAVKHPLLVYCLCVRGVDNKIIHWECICVKDKMMICVEHAQYKCWGEIDLTL